MERRTIGPDECPIIERTTIIGIAGFDLKYHRFYPGSSEDHGHDHPWDFVTMVLSGHYTDDGSRFFKVDGRMYEYHEHEEMTPGRVRYRKAEHVHRTHVGSNGCRTLVLTFPVRRKWGFWAHGRWMPWRDHEAIYGLGVRCLD